MKTKILTTSEVSVNQVAIEVKVMKIGNRQVTLAVFRQLEEEPIINPHTGRMNGIPWGRVNYHVGCENMRFHHLHIVWQDGDELRRAIVSDWSNSFDLHYPYNTDYIRNSVRENGDYESVGRSWTFSYTQLKRLDQLYIAV